MSEKIEAAIQEVGMTQIKNDQAIMEVVKVLVDKVLVLEKRVEQLELSDVQARQTAILLLNEARRVGVSAEQYEALRAKAAKITHD